MDVEYTCPGLSMPQPPDAPEEGYLACHLAGHACTSAVTREQTSDGAIVTRIGCPCCGDLHFMMIIPCTCRETPAHEWVTYGDAVEPGGMREYDPHCPSHGDL